MGIPDHFQSGKKIFPKPVVNPDYGTFRNYKPQISQSRGRDQGFVQEVAMVGEKDSPNCLCSYSHLCNLWLTPRSRTPLNS
jgi:hypothetical protein